MAPAQSKHWCFTVNNYDNADIQLLELLVPDVCDYVVYGYETAPTTGTPHLQGYCIFKDRKRLTSAAAALPNGAHLEVKRGTASQAAEYCKKDGLFGEHGTAPSRAGVAPLDRFKTWCLEFYDDQGRSPSPQEICLAFPSLFLRYRRNLEDYARFLSPPTPLQGEAELYDWQADLNTILGFDPDDRKILFVVDEAGGKGKTFFQRWYYSQNYEKTQLLAMGKRDDVAHAIDDTKSVFFFNIPRQGMEFMNYQILEAIKDRVVFSPKYNSCTKTFPTNVHCVVFCNEYPNMTKMTQDRYHLIEL